ncbi:MAG: hypothetical protein ACSHYB_07560 [Roseibacillus sp.]
MKLNDEVLKFFEGKTEEDPERAQRFAEMREMLETEALPEDLKEALEGQGNPSSRLEERLKGLAKELRKEAERTRQGKMEKLAEAESKTLVAKDAEGQGSGQGEGEGAGQGDKSGKGSGGSNGGVSPLETAVAALEATGDEELKRIAIKLTDTPEAGVIEDLDAAAARISDLMAQLMGAASAGGSTEVPGAYRRAVEDYYRALSDDE